MVYFETYSSNTIAGSGNQLAFAVPQGQTKTGRVFYKIAVAGEYGYSLLFSNIIDSTYASGDRCHKNFVCDQWQIHGAKIGRCLSISPQIPVEELEMEDLCIVDWQTVTFQGKPEKTVAPGEFFATDSVKMRFQKGEYLCLEMTFSGTCIPYHDETLLPVFVQEEGCWKYCKHMPFVSMVGSDRKVAAKVGYIGDSITQGIGAKKNSYLHWNAVLSQKLNEKYAFWNLGLGYGRASDMASGGAWFFRAKQNDILFVCYGVNDILQGFPEDQIKKDLQTIVCSLKKLNKKVILQTVPPFDYENEDIGRWERINRYIKEDLSQVADLVFDNVPCLSKSEDQRHMTQYGGHPNEEGCSIWAEALYEQVRHFFEAE